MQSAERSRYGEACGATTRRVTRSRCQCLLEKAYATAVLARGRRCPARDRRLGVVEQVFDQCVMQPPDGERPNLSHRPGQSTVEVVTKERLGVGQSRNG
jgi:hypothetical protein